MTDLFLNSDVNNLVLNVDYKNAFNCVFRSEIYKDLFAHVPELISYFNLMYGSYTSLLFNEHTISSSRGVKQGDPLGPFLFCLPLQRILRIFSLKFPNIKLTSYADDTSLVGPLDALKSSFAHFVSLSKAKIENISSDEASTLITRYPQRYSFNLKDHEWLINIRLRLGLWPVGLLQKSTCVCGSSLASFHHVVKCHKFIHLRSIIHNSLCDQCLELFQSNGFHGKIEPVLNTLSDSIMRDKSRGDLIDPWLSSQEIIMDFTTIDPCNSTSVNKISDENYSALETAERKKLDRYDELISKMNSRRHNPFVFHPFAISLYGKFGCFGQQFLTDFGKLCKQYGKNFNESYWRGRLSFSLFKALFRYFDSILNRLLALRHKFEMM
ncbi:hypothetical protein GEMRC1_009625 [Eukaryota sp. GEM-RC1]